MRRAVLDTCVLLPINLCDTLLTLAYRDQFSAQWSEEILTELERNLWLKTSLSRDAARRRLAHMRSAFPLALVTSYEPFITEMTNDPKDRHVAAAAVRSESSVVTANLRDFPSAALEPHGIIATHPYDFLRSLVAEDPTAVVDALNEQLSRYRNPPMGLADLLARLKPFVPGFVESIAGFAPGSDPGADAG
jgi:predicted nucleic acid-binding protein